MDKINEREKVQGQVAACLRRNLADVDKDNIRSSWKVIADEVMRLIEQYIPAQKMVNPAEAIRVSKLTGLVGQKLNDYMSGTQQDSSVEEKTYEVTQYKTDRGIWIYRPQNSDDRYRRYYLDDMDDTVNTEEFMLQYPEKYKIWQVKRLSDNSIWTVGDSVTMGSESPYVIEKIEIQSSWNGGIKVTTSGPSTAIEYLKHYQKLIQDKVEVEQDYELIVKCRMASQAWEKLVGEIDDIIGTDQGKVYVQPSAPVQEVKKVLLRTEDGVDITDECQIVYAVYPDNNYELDMTTAANAGNITKSIGKWFSTWDDRNEWIEYNKPYLSQKEVNDVILKTIRGDETLYNSEVVLDHKEKINRALDTYVMDKLRYNK